MMLSVFRSRYHKKKLFNQVRVNQSVPVLFTKNGSKGTVAKVTKTDASIDGINIIHTRGERILFFGPNTNTNIIRNLNLLFSIAIFY